MKRKPHRTLLFGLSLALLAGLIAPAHAADRKPNILVLWGDDIGQFNISAYHRGLMGYRTPNTDRAVRKEPPR